MKTSILISVLLAISFSLFAQQPEPPQQLTKENYLKKSRRQNTAAWLLIGGGLVLTSAGTITALIEGLGKITLPPITPREPEKVSNTPDVLFITGGVLILSSIPLFIAASKNKKKARSAAVSFKNEKVLLVQNSGLGYRLVPSLSLRIQL